MKRPDEVKLEFTREWIRKAEADFKTASLLVRAGDDHLFQTAFHGQQSAEKYIKAFLVWHQVEFPKTHDIAKLLSLAAEVVSDLPEILAEAKTLTPFGVDYRYPGDYPEVTTGDAEAALVLATRVRDQIRGRLPEQALD
ncbi:MAG TPA: HEPN domain-containing protein [Blastocatellia bacterium]|nr:HEPN domain-containing protein [Blastocatellia bacterium]